MLPPRRGVFTKVHCVLITNPKRFQRNWIEERNVHWKKSLTAIFSEIVDRYETGSLSIFIDEMICHLIFFVRMVHFKCSMQ